MVDVRLMFLPVALDTLHSDVEFEEFYEIVTADQDDDLEEIGRVIQEVYRLRLPPIVIPPVPVEGVEEFIDEVHDGLLSLGKFGDEMWGC